MCVCVCARVCVCVHVCVRAYHKEHKWGEIVRYIVNCIELYLRIVLLAVSHRIGIVTVHYPIIPTPTLLSVAAYLPQTARIHYQ